MQRIYRVINGARLKDVNVKKAHVKTIRNELADKTNKVAKNECPKCGGVLVERSGKYGKFKGCGGYPKCRFVIKG